MEYFYYLSWFFKNKDFNTSLSKLAQGEDPSPYLVSLRNKYKPLINSLREELKKQGLGSVAYCEKGFPGQLQKIENPPWALSYKGELALLKKRLLTVVGSRRADPEAVYWLRENVKKIDKSTVLVSGGAIGLDQAVHYASLENSLNTVVVLPSGLMNPYPSSLKNLMKKHEKGKILWLSQFHPHQKVQKSLFYPRNNLLAALSSKTLLIQASEKSGSMVTCKYALDHGREIYVVPAFPWDNRYSGNTKLIEEGASYISDLSFIHL